MSRIQKRIARMVAGRRTSASDSGYGEGRRGTSTGVLPWYSAQPASADLRYALTMNGYVVLS
jgi:hypothetical protein